MKLIIHSILFIICFLSSLFVKAKPAERINDSVLLTYKGGWKEFEKIVTKTILNGGIEKKVNSSIIVFMQVEIDASGKVSKSGGLDGIENEMVKSLSEALQTTSGNWINKTGKLQKVTVPFILIRDIEASDQNRPPVNITSIGGNVEKLVKGYLSKPVSIFFYDAIK